MKKLALQLKLTIDAPDDRCEREADRVSRKIMMDVAPKPLRPRKASRQLQIHSNPRW